MSGGLAPWLEPVAHVIELFAVALMVGALAYASLGFLLRLLRRERDEHSFRRYRADVGRGVLLGLEVLIVADIIATVAVDPTLESLAVLAGIIAIRTFLSLSLEVEISGRWPWKQTGPEVDERQRRR